MKGVALFAALSEAIATYCSDTRSLEALPTSTETTFYPDIRTLLAAVLRHENLPFDVRTGTSEKGANSADMPDFVLGDGALFVGVYGEVKRASVGLQELAVSTEQKDQIGRYLAQTGVVILSNVRGFGLLVCEPGFVRDGVTPVPPEKRVLEKSVDLWSATSGGTKPKIDANAVTALVDIITRAVTDLARISAPADLAKILARQARDAKDALPDDLKPLKPLLDDYRQALGLAFDIDDEKGARFFRSSLVQSVVYALFAAWILWDKQADENSVFDIDDAHSFLSIPFLNALLHDIRHPSRMKHLGLEPHLARAVATLNRVDRPLFRGRMTFPTIDGESSIAAITYFYEPFLEAFDPKLREELGVWYTPPEIVRYQVRRVHHLLKTELDRPRGLADPDVVVLDPCCGTGAYLLEVARCIAEELTAEGDANAVALELTAAFENRVIGFEILTAPFAIAQLQLHLLLDQLGAKPDPDKRLAVFLTNALSGWHDTGDVKLNFPEMREEFDASQHVKREARVIVILGNPPYDRFTGAAQAEEAELVAHYKGIKLVEQKTKDGSTKLDAFGHPLMKQQGTSQLYEEFGVRKQLLDDLYIRFLRLAEERIGIAADYGVVSYISNSSFLTGRSHPIMRRSLLSNFHAGWIDNLNGDKYRTGKIIPQGLPGAGTRDESAFTTEMDPRGIQPGTAITTWLKRIGNRTSPSATEVHYRDFWGSAAWKRQALIASLPGGVSAVAEGAPAYEELEPSPEGRWRLSPRVIEGGFEAWPALDELFPTTVQGVNHNRGVEGGIIDVSASALAERLKSYFAADSFAAAAESAPEIASEKARYDPEKVWKALKAEGHFQQSAIKPFLTFPFDQRQIYYVDKYKWLNEARPEFARNLEDNEWLVTVPEPRKVSETWPLFSTTLVNLHVHERGSVAFPREIVSDDLLEQRDANIAEPAWRVLRDHFGLSGTRSGNDARSFVSKLIRISFSILHAPSYQAEHKSALSSDWAHVPIPRNAELLKDLVAAGEQVVRLLDANRDAREVIETVLTPDSAKRVAQLRRLDGKPISAEDLKVTVTYWGGGKGKWTPRPFSDEELPAEAWEQAWGERTGDLFLNAETHFAHVPEAVWLYQLGGYPVLKKWLGYRQADRRGGKPLSDDERRGLRQMIQRTAALLAMGPTLDALYQKAAADSFTAVELELRT
ncbi:MAG: type ISP restriction/modification enzyme [Pseudomonadota bacterium]